MWAWLRILRRVPTGTSCFFGTTAVSTIWPERRTNLTWLPFWLASTKPAPSSRPLISRKGCGLSRTNLNLDYANPGWARGLRRLEVKFQCFLQVGKSLFFTLTLAGDIYFEALCHMPVTFAPDRCSERSRHYSILSYERRFRSIDSSDPLRNVVARDPASADRILFLLATCPTASRPLPQPAPILH